VDGTKGRARGGVVFHLVGNTATRGPCPHHRPFGTPRRRVAGSANSSTLTAEGAVVIDYETFARICDCLDRQGLTIAQIARTF